ncbi:unnamed protein product [Xylocopa violacea]|uniref:Jouberin n=1 Tax=Xylocopa violacea TaxID=135666 RepID=A0ABP1NUA5_XYLVO
MNQRPLTNKNTHYSDNSAYIDTTIVKKGTRKRLPMFNTENAKSFSKASTGSTDLSEFASRSMNVVVDIHREYEEEKFLNTNIEQNETPDKKHRNLRLNEPENFKIFTKSNTIRDRRAERSKNNSVKHPILQREDDDIKVVGSLDLIEEFNESFVNKRDKSKIETANNQNPTKRDSNRKQWAAPKEQVGELKRPTRKRWSKDTSVIRLPEMGDNSWMAVSSESASPIIQNMKQSLSATRSTFAIDNAAFDSENEEILRIETDYNREDTKIEMKEIVNELEQMEFSAYDSQSSRGSSSRENETFEETAIIIEDLNEPMNLNDQSSENENRNAMLSSKRFDDAPKTRASRRSTSRSKESISQSLEEITTQSDDHSFEDTSAKNDQFLINKKNKRGHRKQPIKNQKHSKEQSLSASISEDEDLGKNRSKYTSQRTITTSENDDFDESCPEREIYDNATMKGSNIKKKKSKYTGHQFQTRQKENKRKKLRKSVSSFAVRTSSANVEVDPKRKKGKKRKSDVKYISVTIHRTDMLEIDYVTKHPMVKVHIVNAENGKYLKNDTSTYLQPVITGKFDFKENKSITPVWEEELVFECNFNELLKTDNEQVVILFEIVDLLSFAEASFNYDKFGNESCWHKVAWAFLKPVGKNNVLHINKKVRLQLYKPRKNSKKFERFHACEVYTWWKSNIWEKYPSSLYVTIMSIDPPKLEPIFYRQLSLHDLSNSHNESQKASIRTSDSINLPKWTRLAAQSCKIPNEIFFETDTSENGCFYVAFSNDGKYLACSFSEEHDYPIVIYEVETKKTHVRFSGHKTFIYSLNWSNNDNYLLSVSSDQTARIWDVQNQIVQHIYMMPHPSYVYCGKFDPENPSIVATGCYDRMTRIWMQDKKSKNRDLSQELEGHEGYINSMYFQKNSNLLTADSVGIIIIWVLKKSKRISSRKEWHISRKIRVREVDGIIINTIILHPLESRLLVHSRDNGLRMLDLATGVVLQKYNELNNQRIQSTACISPCGSLILCGGEDSSLNVWSLETGSLLAKYTFHRNYRAVTCVDYHPYDHVLAFSTFGSPAPVKILKFNKDATGEDIGLKMITEIENTVNSGDISMRFLTTSATLESDKFRLTNKKEIIEETSKERGLEFSRRYDSNFSKSFNSVLSEKGRYNCAKIKLQRLNETGQTLKSRSANRLYNIIERIDRILSNTSRSSGDIESGRNFTVLQESSKSKVLTSLSENVEKQEKKIREDKSAVLNVEDQPHSYFESSTSSGDKQKVVEFYALHDFKRDDWNTKKRSKSAKELRNSNISKDDMLKTFSDSATNYHKIKVYNEITQTLLQENIESNFNTEMKKNDQKSTIYYKNDRLKSEDSNSSGSTGTYIIEKDNMKNSGKNSIKVLRNDLVLNDIENDSNVAKYFESDSSVLSNATFTVENELPVPKPRKKNKYNLK